MTAACKSRILTLLRDNDGIATADDFVSQCHDAIVDIIRQSASGQQSAHADELEDGELAVPDDSGGDAQAFQSILKHAIDRHIPMFHDTDIVYKSKYGPTLEEVLAACEPCLPTPEKKQKFVQYVMHTIARRSLPVLQKPVLMTEFVQWLAKHAPGVFQSLPADLKQVDVVAFHATISENPNHLFRAWHPVLVTKSDWEALVTGRIKFHPDLVTCISLHELWCYLLRDGPTAVNKPHWTQATAQLSILNKLCNPGAPTYAPRYALWTWVRFLAIQESIVQPVMVPIAAKTKQLKLPQPVPVAMYEVQLLPDTEAIDVHEIIGKFSGWCYNKTKKLAGAEKTESGREYFQLSNALSANILQRPHAQVGHFIEGGKIVYQPSTVKYGTATAAMQGAGLQNPDETVGSDLQSTPAKSTPAKSTPATPSSAMPRPQPDRSAWAKGWNSWTRASASCGQPSKRGRRG